MAKISFASCVLALACLVGSVNAAPPRPIGDAEASLRQSMQEALWPADIARLAADYLRQYPRGGWADAARVLYERANASARLLSRKEVQLYKGAFEPVAMPPDLNAEVRRAALGDQNAAIRLAHMVKGSSDMSESKISRYIGWLQFATMEGSDAAAYELAVYYRQTDQPALAAQYEARALALGYVLPTVLDHFRK
jgi:hypothetical protein